MVKEIGCTQGFFKKLYNPMVQKMECRRGFFKKLYNPMVQKIECSRAFFKTLYNPMVQNIKCRQGMILATLKIKSRSQKTNPLLKDLLMRFLCQFGPNLAIGSEGSAEKFFLQRVI